MSNNDLYCSKCKSHHHPVECPLDKESEIMEKPRKIQHSRDCLYVIEPRYYNNPDKEQYCNCGTLDFNEAIELYEPYHKQQIAKLTQELKDKEDANIQLIGELNKLRVEGQEELQEAIGCHKQEIDSLKKRLNQTLCVYCGEIFESKPKERPAKIALHIAQCKKHPLGRVVSENLELKQQLQSVMCDNETLKIQNREAKELNLSVITRNEELMSELNHFMANGKLSERLDRVNVGNMQNLLAELAQKFSKYVVDKSIYDALCALKDIKGPNDDLNDSGVGKYSAEVEQ